MNENEKRIEAEQLGEVVGKIIVTAARVIHSEYPQHDIDDLVDLFTRDASINLVTGELIRGLAKGKAPAKAAGEAGAALIHGWADARLTAGLG